MSEQIEPGEGWRLLGLHETVKDGDEPWHRFDKRWMQVPMNVPYTAKAYPAVRRRNPSKPEPMEIDHQNIRCNSFDEVMQCDDSGEVWRLVSNAEQARQLADWLNRYADWRESQNL